MIVSSNRFLGFVLLVIAWVSLSIQTEAAETLAIVHARLIDGTDGPPIDDAVIVIRDGRFGVVGPAAEIEIAEGAAKLDVQGRTVVPGLIDTHYHMNYPNNRDQPFILDEALCAFRAAYHLRRHLLGGVTTVLDAGAYHNVGFMAKKAYREGLFFGSRPIVVGERINATGGHGVSRFDMAYEADGPYEFRKAVRLQIKSGADLIKILPPYTHEELAAAIDEAHMLRKTVAVHSGYGNRFEYIRWAAELGADVIEHAYALPDDVIEMMGQKGIYAVPTMSIMMRLHEQRGVPIPEDRPHEYEIFFRKMKAAGVKMAIGTDAIYEFLNDNPGLYFDEVERFVRNGYTPHEAIIAATRTGAEVCNAADRLGTIEKGKLADLLVVEGDPLQDINDLRRVSVIIQEGRVIENAIQ